MPPKRASTRRLGAVGLASDTPSYIPGMSSPNARNPALPEVPTKPSFAYGSSTAPDIPGVLAAKSMNLTEVASSIDEGLRGAQGRAENRSRMSTRSRRQSISASVSPVRRRRREPTPDELQLQESLREATMTPNPIDTARSNHGEQSTPTPTPPKPHTLSTASSPATDLLTNPKVLAHDQLYPSPLQRAGSPTHRDISLSSPQFGTSIDNESVISWNVERDIHEDALQRTRPNRYFDAPHGKNISAPPRRISGFPFAHETIEEEEEPVSQISIAKSRHSESANTTRPRSQSQSESEQASEPEPKREPKREPESDFESAPERVPEPEREPTPQISSAPARTIIPSHPVLRISPKETTPPLHERMNTNTRSMRDAATSLLTGQLFRILVVILVAVSMLLKGYTSGTFSGIASNIGSHLPHFADSPSRDLNSTAIEAVRGLSNQVISLGAQVSSLSREVDVVKSDARIVPEPVTVIESISARHPTPKTNFLSPGMGVLVDPYLTSPTTGQTKGLFQRLKSKLFLSDQERPKQSPLSALTAWQDVGECWCTTPRNGVSQLGLLLSRPMVPEEVVVEHIPKGASLRPGVAPQDMELWARFQVVDNSSSDMSHSTSHFRSGEPPTPSNQLFLHRHIMDVLREGYKGEPESAYSSDQYLGPTYYRVGRWRYDLNARDHIQPFLLDAVFDMESIRVDKVVFRIKSNWGANETCIYRVKLHGHM
ncbi:hypothetical protein BDV25DRAFT_63639 [Aspergillus avenaceus]|uniref:SUN domain-containing protein n=1 Tax=Aspergillus avenaceus TaxID=36643 RepID=A0A5N6U8L4_ASPAV|nr:hypothetical protein BDV25DRAFT_63639 [Aspergillus avenaceus]